MRRNESKVKYPELSKQAVYFIIEDELQNRLWSIQSQLLSHHQGSKTDFLEMLGREMHSKAYKPSLIGRSGWKIPQIRVHFLQKGLHERLTVFSTLCIAKIREGGSIGGGTITLEAPQPYLHFLPGQLREQRDSHRHVTPAFHPYTQGGNKATTIHDQSNQKISLPIHTQLACTTKRAAGLSWYGKVLEGSSKAHVCKCKMA